MKFTEDQVRDFIEMLKTAPGFVKENVMCYYYYNNGLCSKCPVKTTCPSARKGNEV